MLRWIKSFFKMPEPAGPPEELKSFKTTDATLAKEGIATDGSGWRIECGEEQTIRLFEIPDPNVDQCFLTYQANIKTEDLQGKTYLEMWCRMPGQGEFFSRGLNDTLTGTNDWGAHEIPFYLKAGQKPDLLKLNLVVGGTGRIWIKDVQLLVTPLK